MFDHWRKAAKADSNMEKSKEQDADRFLLSTFEGSLTCSTGAWVKELDSYMQQHHIFEYETIKFAVLHFKGKAHAWWIFESFSLKNANTSSYARFIEILMGRFGEKIPNTHEHQKI